MRKKIRTFVERVVGRNKQPEFSFCESVHASSLSPWHIRRLTDAGKKLGGGADTKSLCGREMCWDLEVNIEAIHQDICCRTCWNRYMEILRERSTSTLD